MSVIIKLKLNDLSNIHHILENFALRKHVYALYVQWQLISASVYICLLNFQINSHVFFFLGPCF